MNMQIRKHLRAICLFLSLASTVNAENSKPNIVYILADDMGYGDVSALNPESKINTPNIDAIAKEGLSFTDAHSGSAVCTPTRYGILTGRYCWRSKLKKGVLRGYDPHLIEKDRLTVASFLKGAGYHTACIGKWHLGMDFPTTDGNAAGPKNTDWKGVIQNGPVANGFDYYYGISASLNMDPYIYIENDRFVGECTTEKYFEKGKENKKGPAQKDFEAVETLSVITEKSVEYINKQTDGTPFFMYIPLNSPHRPVVPSAEFEGKSELSPYADFCLQTDAVVGKICKALDAKGFTKNTIIIFTSDNGSLIPTNYKPHAKKGHRSSYIFRGKKSEIYEGGHRVPYVLTWPAVVAPGTVTGETMCLTDLLATCAAIIGKPLPTEAGEDSDNMLPVLKGEKTTGAIREATVHHSHKGVFAIRQGKWKLILGSGAAGTGKKKAKTADLPKIQLYDLENDIGETKNVYDQHPEVVGNLTKLLQKYQEEGHSRP